VSWSREETALREELVVTSRRMHATGLVTGTSGNLSVRLGNRVLVTPSSVAYDSLEADGLAVVDIDGTVLEAGDSAPSSETPLHLGIYRSHEDAGAVVHTHAPYATAVGLVREELPSVHYAIRWLGGPVRVAEYATFGSQELADNVDRAMRDRRGALMRNHGAVTCGGTLAEAARNAESLEWLCSLYLMALPHGTPATLTADQLEDVRLRADATGYRP
jgi:L-fuculose-phosphate aldolase